MREDLRDFLEIQHLEEFLGLRMSADMVTGDWPRLTRDLLAGPLFGSRRRRTPMSPSPASSSLPFEHASDSKRVLAVVSQHTHENDPSICAEVLG